MTLVNLDGTSIFGAGSEWFWAMAQFVLVAASILGIYFQLRAQRASSLYEQSAAWSREWNEEPFLVSRLAALLDLESRPIEAGLPLSTDDVGGFFERLGYLIAQKHLRSADIWHSMRVGVGMWWRFMGPYLEQTRKQTGNPALYEWFEKLELEMQRLDRKVGYTFSAPISLSEGADDIARQLRLLADARNGIFPTRRPEPVSAAD